MHLIIDQELVHILSWQIIRFFVISVFWFILMAITRFETFEQKLIVLFNNRLRTRPEILVLLLALENLGVSFGFLFWRLLIGDLVSLVDEMIVP